MSNEFEQSGELRPGLFPEETAEEAVARIVAQNPQKHGVTVQERMARARAAVTRMLAAGADLSDLSAEDATIIAIGGDPNEMMTGNKPRYTVDEAGNVKDHETGEVHLSRNPGVGEILERAEVAQERAGEDATQATAGAEQDHDAAEPVMLTAAQVNAGFQEKDPAKRLEQALARTGELMAVQEQADLMANQSCCAHSWPIKIHPEAQCEKCGLTWRAFCEPLQLDPTQPHMTEGIAKFLDDAATRMATCEHQWPEDPDEDTRCPLCQMTFEDWVNS